MGSVIFIPRKMSRGNRTMNSNDEPTRFARLLDRIKSHLGKKTFETSCELPIIEDRLIDVLM